jgi:hypothetical protein
MRKRKRKFLGSPADVHTRHAEKALRRIAQEAATTLDAANRGRCNVAQDAFAWMLAAYGEYQAHVQSGGEASGVSTLRAMRDASQAFHEQCVCATRRRS